MTSSTLPRDQQLTILALQFVLSSVVGLALVCSQAPESWPAFENRNRPLLPTPMWMDRDFNVTRISLSKYLTKAAQVRIRLPEDYPERARGQDADFIWSPLESELICRLYIPGVTRDPYGGAETGFELILNVTIRAWEWGQGKGSFRSCIITGIDHEDRSCVKEVTFEANPDGYPEYRVDTILRGPPGMLYTNGTVIGRNLFVFEPEAERMLGFALDPRAPSSDPPMLPGSPMSPKVHFHQLACFGYDEVEEHVAVFFGRSSCCYIRHPSFYFAPDDDGVWRAWVPDDSVGHDPDEHP